MRQAERDLEGWKRMVLRSMPRPAWLSDDAPHVDVVLSSRTRVMRNLVGFRFPNTASDRDLERVYQEVLSTVKAAGLALQVFPTLTNAERDHWVSCRLVSHDFPWTRPNRSVLVDADRSLSLMINEEDHLRIQALSAGWSVETSDALAQACVLALGERLRFARHPEYGYLSASPYNSGAGRRRSAMFHLVGLAQGKRLPSVMQALASEGIVARGLFGESSRAMGAFVQISATRGDRTSFAGACLYLLREERAARSALGRDYLEERALQARDFAVSSNSLSLADALRVLGWIRWAAAAEISGFQLSPRDADTALITLDLRNDRPEQSAVQRAAVIRGVLNA